MKRSLVTNESKKNCKEEVIAKLYIVSPFAWNDWGKQRRSNYSQYPAWYFKPGGTNYGRYFGLTNEFILNYAGFQASAAKYMRSALFWDITQRIVVNLYRRFGNYHSYFQGSNPRLVSLTLEVEAGKLSRNVGNELKRCVISQNSPNLILIQAVLVQCEPELNLISQFWGTGIQKT